MLESTKKSKFLGIRTQAVSQPGVHSGMVVSGRQTTVRPRPTSGRRDEGAAMPACLPVRTAHKTRDDNSSSIRLPSKTLTHLYA